MGFSLLKQRFLLFFLKTQGNPKPLHFPPPAAELKARKRLRKFSSLRGPISNERHLGRTSPGEALQPEAQRLVRLGHLDVYRNFHKERYGVDLG